MGWACVVGQVELSVTVTTLYDLAFTRRKLAPRMLGALSRDCRGGTTGGTVHGTIDVGSVQGLSTGRSSVSTPSA